MPHILMAPFLAVAVAAVALAAEPTPGGSAAGRQLFASYCASCHGPDGKGDGPEAAVLPFPPPDLTKLHERYGNPLPRARIAAWIDGRREVKVHGPREMPVWGEVFWEGDPGPGGSIESARRRTVETLVDYLQALQAAQETRLRRGPRASRTASGG